MLPEQKSSDTARKASRWVRTWEKTKGRRVHILVSAIALACAVVHVAIPSLAIDVITITLLVIAVVPWLSHIIKSIEMGGTKVELVPQPEGVRRRIEDAEIAQEGRLGQENADDVYQQGVAPVLARDLRARHLQIEDLGLRYLEDSEFHVPLQRQVMIDGNPNLAVDAVGVLRDGLVLIEIKYLPKIRVELVEQQLGKLHRIATAFERVGAAKVSRAILLLVIDGDDDLAGRMSASLQNRWGWDPTLDLRIMSRDALLHRYRLPTE